MRKTMVWAAALAFALPIQGCTGDSDDTVEEVTEDVAAGEVLVPECAQDSDCDDGDFCTVDKCAGGNCGHGPRGCDDMLFCTGIESCDSVAGECVSSDVPVVDDGIECTVDSCDEELNEVVNEPNSLLCDDLDPCTDDLCSTASGCQSVFNLAPCDDGDLCTAGDVCSEGACAGTDVLCDDDLFCNGVESCDPGTGDCLAGLAPTIDDGIDCTEDTCDDDSDLVVNVPVDSVCDDDDPCSDDWCDPDDGCSHGHNVEPCDDGVSCTVEDLCFQGTCAGYSKECDDALFCNGLESCDDDSGECLGGVEPVLDDGIDCTIDECDEGLGEIVHLPVDADCSDGDICTDDICDPGEGCVHLFNTNPCSDADPCTVDDVCTDGVCGGGPKDCDDTLYCNGLEYCDPVTGVCLSGTPPDPDDGVECTADSCDDEQDLLANDPVDLACNDDNPCTDDLCDPVEGCQHTPNVVLCDDLDPCTVEDACFEGACEGVAKSCDDELYCNGIETCDPANGDCLPGTPLPVDDGVDCTFDFCDDELDDVIHTPDHTKCDDDNDCTDDTCSVISGGCQHVNNTLDCDDADPCTLEDVCGAGICAGVPKVCTNTLYCDGLETCSPDSGDCVSGDAPAIDDEVPCTLDSCDEEEDIVLNLPDDALCNDDNGCTDDSCDPDLGCLFAPNSVACDDGEECTDGDACADGSCQAGNWACEDCTNDLDDNGDGNTDCCDALCEDLAGCKVEVGCGDGADNDCDGAPDCADLDCLGNPACGPYPQAGDLVITEIMQDPAAVGDSFGEWFEVYNASAETFDLRYLKVTDDGDNSFVVSDSLTVAPDERLVFGRKGDFDTNGGVAVDYVYNNFLLSNADDEIRLVLNDVEVDYVAYDGGPLYPDPTGASMQLDPASTDGESNDVGSNWCTSKTPVADVEGADMGTPGTANLPCHEVDCEDQLDDDADGATDCGDADCADLEGCGDDDNDSIYNRDEKCPGWDDAVDEDNDDIPDGCEIDWAGKAIPVSGADWDIAVPHHVELEVQMSGVTELDGAAEGITGTMRYLVAGKEVWLEVAMVYVGEGTDGIDYYRGTIPALSVVPGLPVKTEFVLSYQTSNGISYGYNNDTITDLNVVPVPFTYYATGNAPAPGAGELVITEILKNPEHVPDAAGEWFEVYVAADHVVDLKGIEMADNDSNSHNVMVSVYGEPGAYLVLGANGIYGQNGEVSLNYTYEDFALGNDDDEVLLYNGAVLIDGVAYDAGATFPNKAGAALSLTGDVLTTDGNDDGANWCDASDPFGIGDLGTPGGPNPMCE
jgi:hypothetical protein